MDELLKSAAPTPNFSCPDCQDTGWLHFESEDGYRSGKECKCRLAQKTARRIANSGLAGVLEQWTFDAFIAETKQQQNLKERAMSYTQAVLDGGKPWLFMGGQVGTGKSHLCTAVCGELLKAGRPVRYMQWVTDSRALKAVANDLEGFDALADPYTTVEILLIDDLFKSQHRQGDRVRPTEADARVAFEIINARYIQDKPTIITSEWHLTTDLMEADAGTFSRVYQKCKGFLCEISRDNSKNYRLRGMGK